MEKKRRKGGFAVMSRQIVPKILSFVLLCIFLNSSTAPTQAATWMDPYLETLVEWGVITPDANGNVNGYKQLTRADFVAMVNRAFGYTEVGTTPFVDVPTSAWYAEDICIAYKAGYFEGTSANTASPDDKVTREQATVLLARNLRLEGTPGEVLDFTDSRQMGNWSRGLVQQTARLGIISGYPDGSFRPKATITQGEIAAILVRALGTRISEPGEYSNIGAYNHLTITSPGVTLKNTTVRGNLYLAGGVGLEDVVLENVTVQGRIVVAGGGVAQAGESSVILRNVTAEELVIDSLTAQTLSVHAEGLTNIALTDVRTSAYLEDLTKDGLGLKKIEFDSAFGSSLHLAGNIKEVLNLTSGSKIDVAQGVANVVTVDERATGTTLNIGTNAYIKDLNLDAGTTVSGTGDVDHLNISANGSVVPMLPDTIDIRPGLTADIYGEVMDTAAAAESSADPRILSGYPKAQDVAPKTAQLSFSTNKKGTLYWAVTALADGSVKEEQLLKPSSSSKILKSGTISVASSNTEVFAKLSGLTSGGSYYVSAVLEDNRGMRSPVKVMAFTTPDDTTPAFASGYPKAIFVEDKTEEGETARIVVQAQVMANKDCRLYYALLPSGSTAPKAADFKAAAVTGNLGYGSEDLRKNTPFLISQINTVRLKEETKYDLYFWLTDADGSKSSAVKKLTVETPDKTPPKILYLNMTESEAKKVEMSFALDEPGTFYWAVVKHGVQFYSDDIANTLDGKQTDDAKMQIETGLGALKKGNKAAAKASTDYTFSISGLEPQTKYDLYFVAKDKSGNYNVYTQPLVPPVQINTLDNEPPTVTQEFTHDGTDGTKLEPYPDTSIRLVFSERVQGMKDINGTTVYSDFYQLYLDKKYDDLAEALATHIKLYRHSETNGQEELVSPRSKDNQNPADWVIDYRNATVTMDPEGTGQMIITLPYVDESASGNEGKSSLNLQGGITYHFEMEGIADTSNAKNLMKGTRGIAKLESFTIISAQIYFSESYTSSANNIDFDMTFTATPLSHTSMASEIRWDLIFWCANTVSFDLYEKIGDGEWNRVGNDTIRIGSVSEMLGVSVNSALRSGQEFEVLKDMTKREYGVVVRSINGDTNRENWNIPISLKVTAVSGTQRALSEAAGKLQNSNVYENVIDDSVSDISSPLNFTLTHTFMDNTPPKFTDDYPKFSAGDTSVSFDVMLDRPNSKFYYVIAPVGAISTTYNGKTITSDGTNWDNLPIDGKNLYVGGDAVFADRPNSDLIKNYSGSSTAIKKGSKSFSGSLETVSVSGLADQTEYIAYFVLQGESQNSYSQVYVFRFKTEKAKPPVLSVMLNNPAASVSSVNGTDANVKYMMVISTNVGEYFTKKMSTCWDENAVKAFGAEYPYAVPSDETIRTYKAMTVLEAMATAVRYGDKNFGSVFDLFVQTETRNSISAWFETAQPTGTSIVKTGDMTLSSKNNYISTVDCEDSMSGGKEEYWFVAMGNSTLGSDYSFSAARYLYYPKSSHPMVTSVSFTYDTATYPPEETPKAAYKPYSGEIIIVFDDYLYHTRDGVKRQVVDTSKLMPDKADDYIISANIIHSKTTGITLKPEYKVETTEYCNSLRFKATNVSPDASIVFSGYLTNSKGVVGDTTLTIKMQIVKNTYGLYVPEFYVETSDWDATTK